MLAGWVVQAEEAEAAPAAVGGVEVDGVDLAEQEVAEAAEGVGVVAAEEAGVVEVG